jgi:hypothetical protein
MPDPKRVHLVVLMVGLLAACADTPPARMEAPYTVVLHDTVRLDLDAAGASAESNTDIAALPDGYLVTELIGAGPEIVRFDRQGKLVEVIRREGEGPGEFRWVTNIAVAGDSVWVFDLGLARCSVLDPQLRFGRQQRCDGSVHEMRSNGAQVFIQARRRSPEEFGFHAHVAAGGELLPLVEDSAFALPRDLGLSLPIASGGANSLWITRLPRSQAMRFELWTTTNELVRTLDRGGRPWVGSNTSLYVDRAGSLWAAFSMTPDSVVVEPLRPGELPSKWVLNFIGRRTVTVEVIDPHTGRLLAAGVRMRSDGARFMDNGELYQLVRSDDGGVGLMILRPRVVPTPPQESAR